jgi:membrane peptidoglycan carboxypeptidase
LAYYGGETGRVVDYAGPNLSGNGSVGGHPAGSSFAIYPLAAGLAENVSVGSHWDARADKDGPVPISNGDQSPTCGRSCTLEESTHGSYQVPFYWLSKAVGVAKVVAAAKAAGISQMWGDRGEAVDLTTTSGEAAVPSLFGAQVGLGQYPVTVLDHTNGLATFAARGVHRDAHFVVQVKKRDRGGEWKKIGAEQIRPRQAFQQDQVDDIVAVLAGHPGPKLKDGRPSARLTGTWELKAGSADNGDAWMVGFTPQIAAAVWVGNAHARLPLRYAPDRAHPARLVAVTGANLPAQIWESFMSEAHKGLPVQGFPSRKNAGDDRHPFANGSPPPGR